MQPSLSAVAQMTASGSLSRCFLRRRGHRSRRGQSRVLSPLCRRGQSRVLSPLWGCGGCAGAKATCCSDRKPSSSEWIEIEFLQGGRQGMWKSGIKTDYIVMIIPRNLQMKLGLGDHFSSRSFSGSISGTLARRAEIAFGSADCFRCWRISSVCNRAAFPAATACSAF